MKTIKNTTIITLTLFFSLSLAFFLVSCGGNGDPPGDTADTKTETTVDTKDVKNDKADNGNETVTAKYNLTGTWTIWQVEKDLEEAMPQVGTTQVKIKQEGTKILFEDIPQCVGEIDDDYFYIECAVQAHFWYFYDGNVKETADGDIYIETSRINMASGAPEKEYFSTFVPMDFCQEKEEKVLLVVDQSPDCTTEDFMKIAIAIPGCWEDSEDNSTFIADLHKAEEGDSNYDEIKAKCPDTDSYIKKFGITGIICLEKDKELSLCKKNGKEPCTGSFIKDGNIDFDNSHLIAEFVYNTPEPAEYHKKYIKNF